MRYFFADPPFQYSAVSGKKGNRENKIRYVLEERKAGIWDQDSPFHSFL